VCARPAVPIYSRLAYLVITWLPPLGLWPAAVLDAGRVRALRTVAVLYAAGSRLSLGPAAATPLRH
jgi:hypothetical protein